MRKTVDVDANKVIQVKYIGDENWGNLKEKIENGPKKVRTFMVYLNVESDVDTIMDYIIDPVAGSPSRNRTVNGNVCMHVDDLIFTGADDFLSSFAESLKKSFQIGSRGRCYVLRTEELRGCRVEEPFLCYGKRKRRKGVDEKNQRKRERTPKNPRPDIKRIFPNTFGSKPPKNKAKT